MTAARTIPSPPPADCDDFSAPLGPASGVPAAPRFTRDGEALCVRCESLPAVDGETCRECRWGSGVSRTFGTDWTCDACECVFVGDPLEQMPAICPECREVAS
jgi:hypothetical protein